MAKQTGRRSQVRKHTYTLHYKHDNHGSDQLGEGPWATARDAEARLADIQANPGRHGYYDWLTEASMWVADEAGNICS